MINKIRVIPKRENTRLLEGDLFIVEDLWCVSAADFNIRESGLKGHVRTACKEVQPAVFLPVSTTISVSIDMMGFKGEASYLAAIRYAEVQTDIKPTASTSQETPTGKKTTSAAKATDTAKASAPSPQKHKYELPSRITRKEVQTDLLAGKRDSSYWASVRSVPLRLEEMQSYQIKEEKILQKDTLPGEKKRKPTVAGQALNAFMFGKTFRTSDKKAWLTLPGLPGYVPEYNFVDGFWLGLALKSGVKLSSDSTLYFSPSFYYTTARRNWVGQGNSRWNMLPGTGEA